MDRIITGMINLDSYDNQEIIPINVEKYTKFIIKINDVFKHGQEILNLKKYLRRHDLFLCTNDTAWDYREYAIIIHNDFDHKYTQMLIDYLNKRKFVYELTD